MADSTAQWLRGSCPQIWETLHAHRFLREMADGTLSLDSFRFYLEQDTMYLTEYAKCMALGAARAARVDEVAWLRDSLNNIVDNELPSNAALLEKIIEQGAADRGGSSVMAPATLSYTNFLMATAYRGDALDVMTAILPCALSYREIAVRLGDRIAPDSLYTDWLTFFAGDFYGGRIAAMQASLDDMAAGIDESRREQLRQIFVTASRMEVGFWDMAHGLVQWPDLTPSDVISGGKGA